MLRSPKVGFLLPLFSLSNVCFDRFLLYWFVNMVCCISNLGPSGCLGVSFSFHCMIGLVSESEPFFSFLFLFSGEGLHAVRPFSFLLSCKMEVSVVASVLVIRNLRKTLDFLGYMACCISRNFGGQVNGLIPCFNLKSA